MAKAFWKNKLPMPLIYWGEKIRQFGCLFRPGFSLRSNTPLASQPFFILGCGRSGNTLLRSMLVAGGEVVIPPESYVWPRVIRKFLAYKHLPWEEVCSIIIGEFEAYRDFYMWECNIADAHKEARKLSGSNRTLVDILDVVYRTYGKEKGAQQLRWGDKTPINTLYCDKIYSLFPKAHYVHIVRDPRDVVNSYIKAGSKNPNIDVKDVVTAAETWRASIEKIGQLKKNAKDLKLIEIKYEDLVSKPENTLRPVCEFLEITFSREMLEFWKKTTDLGDVNYYEHHAGLNTPLNTNSIGKWKSELEKPDCDKIKSITRELAIPYGYDLK